MTRNETAVKRSALSVAVAAAACCVVACSASPPAARPPAPTASRATPPAASPGVATLDCSDPIGQVPSPAAPYSSALDALALDTTSLLPTGSGGRTDPHPLWIKTGLLVHAGHDSTLTVPPPWADRVSIAWGNHAAEWTTSLRIAACPSGAWLAFPGGLSIDRASCVPLEVRTGNETATIRISAGVRC